MGQWFLKHRNGSLETGAEQRVGRGWNRARDCWELEQSQGSLEAENWNRASGYSKLKKSQGERGAGS